MTTEDTKIDLSRITIAGARVLVREHDPKTMTDGGLFLPDEARNDRSIATVIKIGDGCDPEALARHRTLAEYSEAAENLAVGDDVLISRYALGSFGAAELGERMHIIDLANIMAVVKPENSDE